ncbi:MAG: hypothetical protein EB114_08625 [Betaproteobacteria bacterium]|nr:hypothetical protein [Betaproteobacteria bacterium]NCW19758.1 hypothetical protein [Betaproteobacteria bacterium]NCZ47928.1 hypothetical protein [Betaproteobacteria bacterium]NCZ75697.1 hypothetical protein [Betaproteobacteria bacterium]NDA04522.1 hypothetical protein [Betaproteobacteria bacterium]
MASKPNWKRKLWIIRRRIRYELVGFGAPWSKAMRLGRDRKGKAKPESWVMVLESDKGLALRIR